MLVVDVCFPFSILVIGLVVAQFIVTFDFHFEFSSAYCQSLLFFLAHNSPQLGQLSLTFSLPFVFGLVVFGKSAQLFRLVSIVYACLFCLSVALSPDCLFLFSSVCFLSSVYLCYITGSRALQDAGNGSSGYWNLDHARPNRIRCKTLQPVRYISRICSVAQPFMAVCYLSWCEACWLASFVSSESRIVGCNDVRKLFQRYLSIPSFRLFSFCLQAAVLSLALLSSKSNYLSSSPCFSLFHQNIYVGSDEAAASDWASKTWGVKHAFEQEEEESKG